MKIYHLYEDYGYDGCVTLGYFATKEEAEKAKEYIATDSNRHNWAESIEVEEITIISLDEFYKEFSSD